VTLASKPSFASWLTGRDLMICINILGAVFEHVVDRRKDRGSLGAGHLLITSLELRTQLPAMHEVREHVERAVGPKKCCQRCRSR
jgi:hypothetical protein